MDPFDKVAAYQHDALDFMLDALDLNDVRDEARRGARLFALHQQAHELIRANQRLRRRVAALDRIDALTTELADGGLPELTRLAAGALRTYETTRNGGRRP